MIIIGGGPAGVLAAFHARRYGINHIVFEKGKIGQSWRNMYQGMKLLSPGHWKKDWTSFTSQFPIYAMPNSGPFPTGEEFVRYMEAFVDKYALKVLERSEVLDITKRENGFRVYLDDFYMDSRFLVISTGVFNNPYIPDIPGADYNPFVVHSAKVVSAEPYAGKRVAIIGAGNSGIELALALSAKADVSVFSRHDVKYFSQTGNITDVRGVSESLFKEMLNFKIVNCYEHIEIKGFNDGTIYFENMDSMSFDSIILATGYRPVLLPVMGAFHETRDMGFPLGDRFGESVSIPGLYYAGGIVGPERQNAFIHCFRRKIPRMMFKIRSQLNLQMTKQ